ncbi:MAG: sulfatase-like hydrolase/transferase [Bacteroidota bacterium]
MMSLAKHASRFLLLSVLGLLLSCQLEDAATPPNIILLMGDDHGWEETGYNAHPHLHTPVLDEMAATGLRLDRFYAAHPSCSPTRASILTGRHPNRYGTFAPNYSLRPEEITIAHLLGEAGYRRGHFGKWHVGPVKAASPKSPGALGFDAWLSHDNFFELDPPLSRNGGPPEVFQGESSAVLVEEAIRFIREAKANGQPFFAVVWFGSPHEPYSGLPEDLARYDDLPDLYADRDSVRLTSNETGQQVTRPLGEVLRERYAEITAMDRAIGTLRDALRQEGLRENTLVWYTSDNGTPPSGVLASPLRGRKGQLYDGGIRAPTVIEWPARITAPGTSATNAVTTDILPTLCHLVDACTLPSRPLDGTSLLPVLEGRMTNRPPIFFWDFRSRHKTLSETTPWIEPDLQTGTTPLVKLMNGVATRSFRNYHHPTIDSADVHGARVMLDGQYKLVVHDGETPAYPSIELFDIRTDPGETTNLAAAQPATVRRMQAALGTWQQSVLRSLTGADYDNALNQQ